MSQLNRKVSIRDTKSRCARLKRIMWIRVILSNPEGSDNKKKWTVLLFVQERTIGAL